MSYTLQSDHLEALQDGRLVEPGTSLSEAEAKKNPNLTERGVLEKEPERRKPPKNESAPVKAAQEPAAAPQEKEE